MSDLKGISNDYGDYSRQVVVEVNGKHIQCDWEIATEIAYLNLMGIKTIASCSGHGKQPPVIAVAQECEQNMVDLGYKRVRLSSGATAFSKSTGVCDAYGNIR